TLALPFCSHLAVVVVAAHATVLHVASGSLCSRSSIAALGRQPLRAGGGPFRGHLVRRLAHGHCALR
ncbi:hypothetical protein GW17_00058854, partial [Ensete ventricosum]